jgi:hypothetical protein
MSKDMISLLPFVLRHCPKLYEFSATIYNPVDIKNIKNPPAPSQTMTTAATNAGFSSIASIPYKEMPIPSVQAMRINSRTNQSPLIGPFLSLWPNLSHLILLGHSLTSVLAQTAIPRMKLYELQCIRSTPGLVVPSVFQGLLKASVGSLKILDISGLDYGTIKGMKDFFVEHGPHLRSLRLPVIPPDIPLPFLQHCTELEELIVYSYPCPTIRQHIPVEKLVHVSFVILTSQASQTLKPMIAWLRKMPQLKVLTWTTRPGGDCNLTNDTKTLQKLCTAMNVYLRSTEPISINVRWFAIYSIAMHLIHFFQIKSEELIQPSSFPRDELITPVWR